ncbi:hypothetical protein LL946_04460 [Knoellia locipacati]|uniref:hypothetical protein n=1 Tax=Knoellia locipacati TaxID=882824 RepID=UPI00384E4238
MTVGAGDIEAGAVSAEAAARTSTPWQQRLVVALGGAVVATVALLLVMAWPTGLRPSTFEQLRADIADGSVHQWYASEQLESGPLDLLSAPSSTVRGDLDEPMEGGFMPPEGDPLGGILVWRTWGSPGWHVAAQTDVSSVGDDFRETATEESTALVAQLRAAQVPMRPYEFSQGPPLQGYVVAGGLLVLVLLVAGPAPRVGTRWFWFWVLLNSPVALGFVAYAVLELIGIRPRPDPPLRRRLTGVVGFFGALLAGLVLGFGAEFLRSLGIPLPL